MALLLLAQARDDMRRRDAAAADCRIQIVEISEGKLAQHRLSVFRLHERGEARRLALRLGIQHLLARGDVLLLELLLVEIADFGFRLRGLDDLEPIAAGTLAVLLGDDFDKVARLQRRVKRHDAAVHLRAYTLVANRGMDAIGKVNRRRAAGQIDDLALGREDEDFIAEQVDLERFDELLGVARVVLPVQNLAQPVQLVVQTIRRLLALLVAPVRRDAVFCDPVHLIGANLHLKGHAVFAHDRRMQRLVHVGLGHGDIVLEAVGHLLPERMHDAQHRIAILHAVHQYAQRDQVVNLLEGLVLQHHLAIDAVKVLGPAIDLELDAHLPDLVTQRLHDGLDVLLALGAFHANLGDQVLIAVRVQIPQAQVLQLLLDLVHAQAVCQRRVDIQRLLRDAALALRGLRLERAHVVRAVRQLDEDDADVLAHRQDHLTDGLRLLLHARGKIKPFELGDAIHQQRDLRAELLADDVQRHVLAVLHRVMQKARGDCRRIQHQLGQNARHNHGMDEVRLAGFALLPLMCLFCKVICLFNQCHIGIRMVFDHRSDQFVQILAFIVCQSGIPPSLYDPFRPMSLPRSGLASSETLPLFSRV